MIYVIAVYDPMQVSLQFTDKQKAYDAFDRITNNKQSAYLYKYTADGKFWEIEHVNHQKTYNGVMR